MAEMEKMFYEAAIEGSVASLLRLLKQDQLILHRFVSGCFTETPLHIAAMLGHLEFAKAILARFPQMAGERDTARNSSPLHLASANGHLELVKELLLANPDMCLAEDCQGRNPIHIAVIKGHTEVLKELVRANPLASRAQAGSGTILHLCVKHHQLQALEYLVGMMADDRGLINSKDHDGSTILHLAAETRQQKMLEFLRSNRAIDADSRNTAGFSAFDIERQVKIFPGKSKEIREEHDPPERNDEDEPFYSTAERGSSSSSKWNPNYLQKKETGTGRRSRIKKSTKETQHSWLERKKQALMVVAGLIATVTFQAGITPPGGLWQDTTEDKPPEGLSAPAPAPATAPHTAGFSIMAYNYPDLYYRFLIFNSTSLMASLTIILLLVSGLPLRHRLFMWILMVIIWVAITAMALTYLFSIVGFTPDEEFMGKADKVVTRTIVFWMGLMALLLLGQTIRLTKRAVKKIRNFHFGSINQFISRSSLR